MSITQGDKARRRLAKGLKRIANDITIVCQPLGTECAGGFDLFSHEWDPKKDRAYHAATPAAPACVSGRVNAAPVTRVVKGFHFPSLRDSDLRYFGIGEININQAVFLVPYDQDVAHIQKYANPTIPMEWFGIAEGYPRSIALTNDDIFWIAKATKI